MIRRAMLFQSTRCGAKSAFSFPTSSSMSSHAFFSSSSSTKFSSVVSPLSLSKSLVVSRNNNRWSHMPSVFSFPCVPVYSFAAAFQHNFASSGGSNSNNNDQLAVPTAPGETTLSARNIAVEANQMKKLHIDRGNPMLAQQARRMLFATSIAGQNIDARSVALLLNTAVYFGMESDARIVRECVDYCLKNDKLITMDVIPIVVTACATLKSKDAREVIEMQAQKALRNAKYLDSKDVTNIISAFSKTNIRHEKLFLFLSKRVQTLGRLGEFEASHLVILANAFARLQFRDKSLFATIARRAMSLRERMTVHELVPLIVSFSKIGLKDTKLSKRFAAKAMEYVDQMNAMHVAQLFQAFAYFGVRYDQLFGVLTNRAVELIDEFNAQYIAVTLHAFQKISINNPELFDNLAERALAVVADHDARDISKTIMALAHFGLKDEELFKRLASHAASLADQFDPNSLVCTVYAFAKTNFVQQDIAVALSERSVHLCRHFDASDTRKVIWAFAKFGVRDPKVLGPLFNRAMALHFDFFADPAGAEEVEEIFDEFGDVHCQALYQVYMSRGEQMLQQQQQMMQQQQAGTGQPPA